MERWTLKYGHEVAETRFPGVWKIKSGGWLIRARVQDPRKQLREVRRVVDAESAAEASRILQYELDKVRAGETAEPERKREIPTLKSYSVSWLERKILRGKVKSAASRKQIGYLLRRHLIPAFGSSPLDRIRPADVEAWLDKMGRQIQAGSLSPRTANERLALLRRIMRSASKDYELSDPTANAESFGLEEHPSYTEEQPNSLLPDEVPVFLPVVRQLYPQHFAAVALGIALGLRPSSLRPLRRTGEQPDFLVEPDGSGWLLVRRSHTQGQEVMESTKTGARLKIPLDRGLVEVLLWHIDRMNQRQRDSGLLFPTKAGKLASHSALTRIWAKSAAKAGLKKHLSARCMRRTFQDLCRRAAISGLVTRSISGHATVAMQEHYSTVNPSEQREALGKVIDLMGVKRALGGVTGGVNRADSAASADSATGARRTGS